MPSHPVRPPYLHHHIHQPAMHPQHPPPVGMNVPPQVPPPQQQHHIQPHGGPPPQVSQYISHQRDQNRVGHHHQQRMGQQVHQSQLQAKSRANLGHSGLLISSMQQPPPQQPHQTQNQIQPHIQQKPKPQTNPINHLGTPSNPGSVHSVAQHHHQQQKQTSQGIAQKPQRILQHNDKRAQNMQGVTQPKTIILAQKPSLHQQSQQPPQQPQQQPPQKQPPPQQQQPPPQQPQKPQQPQAQPQLPQQQQVNQTQQHQTQHQQQQHQQQQHQQQQQQQQQAQDTNKDMLRGINLQSTNETLANIKEKTSMCLVNELARYNKIQHQYRLTGEQGPAHSKKFTVTLKLGDEEYTADGPSIKKAQHSAAGEAISKTKYEHPPAKTNRIKTGGKGGSGNITPTVELNALAMKLGEPAIYVLDSVQNGNSQTIGGPHNSLQQSAQSQNNPPQTYYESGQYGNINRNNPNSLQYQRLNNFRGRTSQRGFSKFAHQRVVPFNGISPIMQAEPCRITLIVGMRKFLGVGPTLQAARHDAAARALEVLKPLVVSDIAPEQSVAVDVTNSDLKSPISLVHEIALKRNLTVTFEVQSERGPPHMKTFVTLCKVGTMVCEGEGNGKKISKKRAAEKMLEELKKLPPVSPLQAVVVNNKTKSLKRKPQPVKKKTRNLIKENAEPDYPEEVNPISKLIQIQQALKEREPVYTVIEERGAPRRREFVIEVSAGGHTARGTGPNKKMAKRLAAENLLTLMGHTVIGSSNKENNPKTANIDTGIDKTRKVTFQENVETLSSPVQSPASNQPLVRQLVPGLLIMQKNKEPFTSAAPRSPTKQINKNVKEQPTGKLSNDNESISNPAVAQSGNETSATSSGPNFSGDGVRPKDQLLYLAQLLGFHVQFSDYPKGNHGEYLTIVTLSTDPPQLCHGAGCNTEASQEQASITALRILSELGLDNVKPKKPQQEEKKIKPILTNGLKK